MADIVPTLDALSREIKLLAPRFRDALLGHLEIDIDEALALGDRAAHALVVKTRDLDKEDPRQRATDLGYIILWLEACFT